VGDPSKFDDIGSAADLKRSAQWWLLFAIMVANKQADQTAAKLNLVLTSGIRSEPMPFHEIEHIHAMGRLEETLINARTGQYTRIAAAFRDVAVKLPAHAGDDPRKWSLTVLESVPGIGPKTARWFYLLCHPKAEVAALDTHVLKFLRDNGHAAPKATPAAGSKYRYLEAAFVGYAQRTGMAMRDFDFMVWAVYRNGGHITFD